ncbi:MAG: hypothetical protein WDO14_19285 [Bacteroidota bacterium]
MTEENYIGDKNTFAIRHVSGYSIKDTRHFYSYCHLVLGGQIIGNKEESCYLSSWKATLENRKEDIKNRTTAILHPEFENRSDEELFELIWKANQSEEDYKPEFSHLPVLNSKVWASCHLSIGETTDAYLIDGEEFG